MSEKITFYPLTHPQWGVWYTEKLNPGTSIGNVAGTVKIRGSIDYSILEKAINIFIEKNDSIRIRINTASDEPRQYVHEYQYMKIDYFDFSSSGLDAVYAWDKQQSRTPFNLVDSDLFYFAMIKINDNEGALYIKTHHLVSDAWTMSLIASQIMEYYSALVKGLEIEEGKKPSYLEFVEKESNYMNSRKYIKDREFWNGVFDTVPEITSIKPFNAVQKSSAARRKSYVIRAEVAEAIRKFCLENKISVFTMFLSILSVYLNRITLKDDIVLGTAVLNRANAREKETVGMFISTIPLRVKIDAGLPFTEFIQHLSREWMQFLRHHEYPYEQLIKEVREKHKGIVNLYNIVISYQNARLNKEGSVCEFEGRWHFNGYQKDPLYIHLNEREGDGNIILDYDYIMQLYSEKEIESLHNHLMVILEDLLTDPHKRISEVEVLTGEEKTRILEEFNSTGTDYPKEKTLDVLFEEQAERTPSAAAVVFEDRVMTYSELNERANRLARVLRSKGIGPDRIVALMVRRSFDMIVGIMGILKAGGAFLPIDPDFPKERIGFMLKDSNAGIIIAQPGLEDKIDFEGEILNIEDTEIQRADGSNPGSISKPGDLAYVIYTSGSTGIPKGVMIEHRSVHNFTVGVSQIMDFSPGVAVLSITTMSFDVFIFEILPSLLRGLKIVLANETEQKIPRLIGRLIEKHGVEKMHATPSRVQLLVDDEECMSCLGRLKEIIIGGEVFPKKLLLRLRELTNARIFNGYGPSEATVGVTFKELTKSRTITIGRPIANTRIYILDKHLNPVPVGIEGEIYISGDCLARGYLNRQELTAEVFISNPFEPGSRMYKTGDLARWCANGEIEFIGRVDHQVKIRGLRIELGEIESLLLSHDKVKKAVVVDREDGQGRKYLCAYYVAEGDVASRELRSFLERKLPVYMVPSGFVKMDEIPLTPNGKVDREKLPEPDNKTELQEGYMAPVGPTEEKIAEIWSQVLQAGSIGAGDNFFELGGDSLSAIITISRIHKLFQVEVPLSEFYKHPTVRLLAEYIDNSKKIGYMPISPAAKQDYYPVSSAQKRLYALMRTDERSIAYNMPWAAIIEGKIDKDRLETALQKIIDRHEVLRTGFEYVDNEPVQRIAENVEFRLEYREAAEEEIQSVIEDFVKPFNLEKPPLIRALLMKISDDRSFILIDMPHIISDWISVNIILRELDRMYNGDFLKEPGLQYKDFAVWQESLLHSDQMMKQERYWLDQFSGEIPLLNLPTDFPRPRMKSIEGNIFLFRAGRSLTRRLRKLAAAKNVTLHTLLLASYYILLSRYSQQEDIVVGMPVSSRNHADLEDMVGFFVNTLPVRSNVNWQQAFEEYLENVKDTSLKALENQAYPLEELLRKLRFNRDPGRNPLFDTVFVMQDAKGGDMAIGGFRAVPYEFKYNISKFDISLIATEKEDDIAFCLEFCTRLFRTDTIRRIAGHFKNILKEIAGNPGQKIGDISLLSEKEKYDVLYGFNNTAAERRNFRTIHEMFEEQATRTPDAVAVECGNRKLTYRELNEKANQLAAFLRDAGVGKNSIVAMIIGRIPEFMVGMMGVLKAGGAYLPVDPDFPDERIRYILQESNAAVLLVQKELRDKIPSGYSGRIFDIRDGLFEDYPVENPVNINTPEDAIYAIYTSGSTGMPKGVLLTHRSVCNLVMGTVEKINYKGKTVLSITSVCFDAFVLESLLPLTQGCRIVIADEVQQKMPDRMNRLIAEKGAHIIHITPTRLQSILEDDYSRESFKCLTDIVIGGEVLTESLLDRLRKKTSARIYYAYGPTETTVQSTICDITKAKRITIGKPIRNTRIYILDRNLKPVPVGVAGELCISGDGLAKSYINTNSPDQERFTLNPFEPGERMYRTGDLARWLPDGNIEFIGRLDQQVKIRGFRIELGEVEKQLLKYKPVHEAVVIDREDRKGNRYLCAYLVADAGFDEKELKACLYQVLPYYMVPLKFVLVDKIPVTTSGKVDKNALLKIGDEINTIRSYTAPRNETEQLLARFWSEVLNVEKVGIDDCFFELGGDSLSVMNVQVKAFKHGLNLSTQDFYNYQTVRELAEYIREKENLKKDDLISRFKKLVLESIEEAACASYDGVEGFKGVECFKGGIFLTGATGFLGIHILNELLESSDRHIYCLVRGKDRDESEERLLKLLRFYFPDKDWERLLRNVSIITGDITKERFGLGDEEYSGLVENTGVIIHTAALVKHFGIYQDFERINAGGTREVISFASRSRAFLNHISTTSILEGILAAKGQNLDERNDGANFYSDYVDNVYIKSKYEAENLVLDAVNSGLPAAVIRVGNLTGRHSDGHFQVNMKENLFYNILKSIIKLGRMPREVLEQPMEFTPVDLCARAIACIAVNRNNRGEVFNLFNHNTISISDLLGMLDRIGMHVEVLHECTLKDFMISMLNDEALAEERTFLLNYFKHGIIYKGETGRNKTVDCLGRYGFDWPEISEEYIGKILGYMKKCGFI